MDTYTSHFKNDFTSENKSIEFINYFKQYTNIHEIIFRFSFYCTLVIIVLLLPIYAITRHYYSTPTYEYAWTVSILYLSRKIAFGLIMSALVLFIIINVYIFQVSVHNTSL